MKFKTLLNTAKTYGHKSFAIKSYIVFFIVLSIPFLILAFTISHLYRENLTSSSNNMIQSNISESVKFTDLLFDDIDKFHMEISASDNIPMLLYTIDFSNSFTTDSIKNINSRMNEFINSSEVISSVYIYSNTNKYVFTYGTGVNEGDILHFNDTEIIKRAHINKKSIICRKISESNTLSVCIPLWPKSDDFGLLIINIDANLLAKKYGSINPDMYEYYIVDKENHIIASNIDEFFDKNISDIKELNNITSSPTPSFNAIDSSGIYTSSLVSDKTGLTFIFNNKNASMHESFKAYTLQIITLIILILLLNVIISGVLTIYFYQYIALLVTAFEVPNSISYSKILKLHSFSEISFLINTVIKNSNTSSINEEFKTRIKALEQQHAMNLQSQINPHFISNTMNAINSTVMRTFKCETPISIMITDLSELLNYTFRLSGNVVTLKTELYYLKYYIEIEKLKNCNNFEIIYDIDDTTLNNIMLKFSIQPIIENSIFHGIHNGHGIIKILSYFSDNIMTVEISDNGHGIDTDTLSEIKKLISESAHSFVLPDKYIGIINTHRRISILFGAEFGCDINSDSNGTTVKLKFPRNTES